MGCGYLAHFVAIFCEIAQYHSYTYFPNRAFFGLNALFTLDSIMITFSWHEP